MILRALFKRTPVVLVSPIVEPGEAPVEHGEATVESAPVAAAEPTPTPLSIPPIECGPEPEPASGRDPAAQPVPEPQDVPTAEAASALETSPPVSPPAIEPNAAARAAWRGRLDSGSALTHAGIPHPALSQKYREELAYWVGQKHGESQRLFGGPFWDIFRGWQIGRMNDLAHSLGLADLDSLRSWASERTAVEIGPGPFPSAAMLPWRRAIAVDALADGYVQEDLVPPDAAHVMFLASSAEHVPLPSGVADVLIAENCLDHVDDPDAVLAECRRLLKPDGMLWLLVDLMDFSDCMHPSPFNEHTLRGALARHGFAAVRERINVENKSHPKAYAEFRALLKVA